MNILRKIFTPAINDTMDQASKYDRRSTVRNEVTQLLPKTPYVALTESQGGMLVGCMHTLIAEHANHKRLMATDRVYADKFTQAARLMMMMPDDQASYYVRKGKGL